MWTISSNETVKEIPKNSILYIHLPWTSKSDSWVFIFALFEHEVQVV